MSGEVNRFLPRLRGVVDARAEAEIHRAFENIYNHFQKQLEDAQREVTASREFRRQIESSPLFAGLLAVPLIENTGNEIGTVAPEGELSVADIPNLPANKITSGTFALDKLPTNLLKTDDSLTEDVVGAPNVNTGKITIKDNDGNLINVMTCA